MDVSLFDYDLPEELIAQHPLNERDHSRLMAVSRTQQSVTHDQFYNIPKYLKPGDTLVLNDSRVIPARLLGNKADTGGKVEVFLLNRVDGDVWEVLVKPGKKALPGTEIRFGNGKLACHVLEHTEVGGRLVRFSYEGEFDQLLDQIGEVPLPPYIKAKLGNAERYQTVYSQERGSVAAPTAGLHFTETLLNQIREQGVQIVYITLHVGLGTFRPVSVSKIEEHVMHKEHYAISQRTCDMINRTKQSGGRVIAVGTTVARTLESAAAKDGTMAPQSGWTDIFIYPGYTFKILDGLITNFHLPQSTLLMLVSALAGREFILEAYHEAVREKYRFFSFGDAMVIL